MRDTENVMKQFWEYVEKNNIEINDDNIQKVMDSFIPIYNERITKKRQGLIELSDEEKAYELFEKALETSDFAEGKKLLKKAIKLKSDFTEAKMELALYIDDPLKRIKELERLTKLEKQMLEQNDYFNKDNIPHFYGILETRLYMRLLHATASNYRYIGCNKKAISIYEYMITLNENDNLGARHFLMGLYALLEDKEKMDRILNKYPEKSVPVYLFQTILYFKLTQYREARKHLRLLHNLVPEFKKLFMSDFTEEDLLDYSVGAYYRPFSLEEILMFMSEFKEIFLKEELMEWFSKELMKMK